MCTTECLIECSVTSGEVSGVGIRSPGQVIDESSREAVLIFGDKARELPTAYAIKMELSKRTNRKRERERERGKVLQISYLMPKQLFQKATQRHVFQSFVTLLVGYQ